MKQSFIKLFLRISLSTAFLSAVFDRFGLWPKAISAWGNWDNFLSYTAQLNPWLHSFIIAPTAYIATILEILLGVFLLVGLKTELMAKISGYLLLSFAIAMTLSTGIKSALDYSVYSSAAAAFALSTIKGKFMEIDTFFLKED